MKPTSTFLTLITAAPYLQPELLFKRDNVVCGDLHGAYPSYVVAPVCSGVSSICTFLNGFQGCCDTSQNCQIYTTCNGDQASVRCSDSQCLQCSSSYPYCTKYNFFDGTRAYDGYSCGAFSNTAPTIYGSAYTVAYTGSSSIISSTSASASTNTASTASRTSSSSASLTGTVTSAAASASATGQSGSKTNVGAIAGGVVGGVFGLIIIAVTAYFIIHSRNSETDSISDHGTGSVSHGEIQQIKA